MMYGQTSNQNLASLYRKIDNCPYCKREKNELSHILGIGKTNKPSYAFVLINPTYRNISSHPDYFGWRFPYVGVKSLWSVLFAGNIISNKTYALIKKNCWVKQTLVLIKTELESRSIYLTNFSKCTRKNSLYPTNKILKYQEELLVEELSILSPKFIITFGLLPFQRLTGKKIKLEGYYQKLLCGAVDTFPILGKYGLDSKVIPCYFPTGRGDPKRSAQMLSLIFKQRMTEGGFELTNPRC